MPEPNDSLPAVPLEVVGPIAAFLDRLAASDLDGEYERDEIPGVASCLRDTLVDWIPLPPCADPMSFDRFSAAVQSQIAATFGPPRSILVSSLPDDQVAEFMAKWEAARGSTQGVLFVPTTNPRKDPICAFCATRLPEPNLYEFYRHDIGAAGGVSPETVNFCDQVCADHFVAKYKARPVAP